MSYNASSDRRGGGYVGFIAWIIADSFIFIKYIAIGIILFVHLFECHCNQVHRCRSCVKFSDRHNWIIEPSKVTKIASILTTLIFAIYGAMALISYFCPSFVKYVIVI